MKKTNDDITNKEPIDDDLDIFEELEKGEGPDPASNDIQREAGAEFIPVDVEEEQTIPETQAEAPPAEEDDGPAASQMARELVELSPDIPVNLVAVIGKVPTNVGDIMKLKMGSVVSFDRPPNETVDIVANGKLIAKGELVEIDGKLGAKIIKLLR